MCQAQPLKGGLRQDERFPFLESDDVSGARAAVEERDLAEQVARFEEAGLSRPLVGWNDDLERASRDDEEAPNGYDPVNRPTPIGCSGAGVSYVSPSRA